MNPSLQVEFADILRAAERLQGVAHHTPVLTSTTFNQHYGVQAFFKAENFQRMGAFKFRGAYNAIASLAPEVRARGVAAFSSGNHAQAMGLSARLFGIPATIVMPQDAPVLKINAARGYGAEVILYNRYTESREKIAADLAEQKGYTLIPPFDHPDVIAGQGTAALELMQHVQAQSSNLDVLLVCSSGGGLVAGCALAAKALNPNIEVYAVEPGANGGDTKASFDAGKIVDLGIPRTICDGLQTPAPGVLPFSIMQRTITDVLTVSDAHVTDMMRFYFERMKIVVEPSGAVPAAAIVAHAEKFTGKRVGVIISGGNIGLERFIAIMSGVEKY